MLSLYDSNNILVICYHFLFINTVFYTLVLKLPWKRALNNEKIAKLLYWLTNGTGKYAMHKTWFAVSLSINGHVPTKQMKKCWIRCVWGGSEGGQHIFWKSACFQLICLLRVIFSVIFDFLALENIEIDTLFIKIDPGMTILSQFLIIKRLLSSAVSGQNAKF